METSPFAMLILHSEGRYSIQINNHDHFRIQVSLPGLKLEEGYRMADEADENLSRIAHMAYDDQFGYLGADLSSVGTGLRASAVLHLPSMSLSGVINETSAFLKDMPVSITGFSDLNGVNSGSMYHVSNKKTLGLSEVDIIETLDSVISRIISTEDEERENLYTGSRRSLEDRILRSYGILRYAKIISYAEALNHLSNMRLGIILAFIKGRKLSELDSIMVNIQKCHLEKIFNRVTDSAEECDVLRAEYLNRMTG
jgi:protein arginine kinase